MQTCKTIIQYSILSFFFLLPFHAFAITFINSLFFDVTSPAPLLLSAWKEIILALFFLISGIWILRHFQETRKEFDSIDSLIVSFSLLALLLSIWKTSPIESSTVLQTVIGIKYDLFFLWILFCCKHLEFSKEFFQKSIQTIILSGIFVIIFAYIQKFSSPDLLIQFGFFDAPSVDTAEKPASFCQLLENTNTCRLTSFFAGPIRFGAFLVFLSGLLLMNIFKPVSDNKNYIIQKISQVFFVILLLSIFPLLFWTYSRGAWIAETILIIVFLFQYFRIPLFSWKSILSGTLVFTSIIAFIVLSGKSESLLFREGSTGKHIEGITESWEIIMSEPTGQGLGTAGAASAQLADENKFLNENWYLQIFTEMGIAGGIIFLLLILYIGMLLYRKNSQLFPLFLAFSVMALFTHLWEESALAYVFWALLGMELRKLLYIKE